MPLGRLVPAHRPAGSSLASSLLLVRLAPLAPLLLTLQLSRSSCVCACICTPVHPCVSSLTCNACTRVHSRPARLRLWHSFTPASYTHASRRVRIRNGTCDPHTSHASRASRFTRARRSSCTPTFFVPYALAPRVTPHHALTHSHLVGSCLAHRASYVQRRASRAAHACLAYLAYLACIATQHTFEGAHAPMFCAYALAPHATPPQALTHSGTRGLAPATARVRVPHTHLCLARPLITRARTPT
jgi:hypothetical protein